MANQEEEEFKYLEKGKILTEEYNLYKEARIDTLKMLAEQAYWYNKFELARKTFAELIALDKDFPSPYFFRINGIARKEIYRGSK